METKRPHNPKRDLTEGGVVKKLIFFALPLIASNLIMQLYNVADSIIVGNFVSSDALAAVGASFPIMMLFNALFMGIAAGAGIVVAQYFGAKNTEGLKKAVNTTFTLTLIVGGAITVLGVVFSKSILSLMGTPENIFDDSAAYLMIIFAGMLGGMVYSIGGGILRGMGDSKWPLYFLILSSVMNISLDLLFVVVLHWGVAGAAVATIIAQFISAILVYRRLARGGYGVSFDFRQLGLDGQAAKTIIRLGLPSGIQMMAMSLGSMIIQTFSNGFGSDFIAANSIVMRTDGFVILPMMGFGMALTTFVGQNVGAGKVERAKHGIHASVLIVAILAVSMGIILYFFGEHIMRVFTDNTVVLGIGKQGIQILAFVYIFMGIDHTLAGAMRGAGAAVAPMITGLLGNLTRIPIAYFLAVKPNDYIGLFYAMAISMAFSCILIIVYYLRGSWKTKAIVAPPVAAA